MRAYQALPASFLYDAQARTAEDTAEELLVDEGWKLVEVEPETIVVNGNGHDDLFGIGPTVELVPVNGHAPANGNGNGHHEEVDGPQQSLFSWTEFMAEEPVKPKGRKEQASARKPLPLAGHVCGPFLLSAPVRPSPGSRPADGEQLDGYSG